MATVMLVCQICSPLGDQLVPLALLLTVVKVRFRLFLFLQVEMLYQPSQLYSAHNEELGGPMEY